MPVILHPIDYGTWLDPTRGGQELLRDDIFEPV
jgi:hypothetical protein